MKRQPLFVESVLTGKPVFVVSVLTAKPLFVVSVGCRVIQKNLKFTNFLSIWKMKLYSIRCMKYFSWGILSHNCDFVGPFNLTISCIKVKIWVLNFWGCYKSRAASQNCKIYGIIKLAHYDLPFLVMAKKLLFVTILEKK